MRSGGAALAHCEPISATGSAGLRAAAIALVLLELLALLALLALAVQLRVANVEHYTGSFDEGIRAEQLLLMERGFRPFRDIFASQGPLLLDLLYPFYTALGSTLGAARLGVSVLSVLGLIGAWWTARALSPLAAVLAAAVLSLSPLYLEGSRLTLAEVPSLAPCIWALGCGLRWQRGGRPGWLYAGAALAAFGVLVKPMALPVLVPLTVLALSRPGRRWPTVLGATLLAATLLVIVVLALDAGRVLEVLGAYRLGAQRPAGSAAMQNIVLTGKVLLAGEKLGLPALVLAGAVAGGVRWPLATLALLSWPLATLSLFVFYTDLADKHVVYLLPPLALVASLGPAVLAGAARHLRGGPTWRWALAALTVAALAAYAGSLPGLWRADGELLRDADDRARRDYVGTQEQALLMAALTEPDEFVLTDHPLAAFIARRPVPPWLVDTSGTRVDAGSLTSEVAIREASAYRPAVIVTWRRRLGKLEGFTRWMASDYRLVKSYPGSDPSTPLQLYVRADLEQRARSFLAAR